MTIIRVYAEDYYNQPYAETAQAFDNMEQAGEYKAELESLGYQYVVVEEDSI